MKKVIAKTYFLILAVCIPLAVGGFVHLTNDPVYRMAYLKCPGELIHYTSGPTDYLIAGSSRTLLAVDATQIGKRVDAARRPERDTVVVSLGRSWKGNGQVYHMFRDYLETHTIHEAFALEFSYVAYNDRRSPLYYNGYYPNYPLVTHTADFAEDLRAAEREPFYIGWHNYLMLLQTQVIQRFERLFSKRPRLTDTTMKPLLESQGCLSKENPKKNRILDARDRQITKRFSGDWKTKPLRVDQPDIINVDRPRYYVKKIAELARQNGVDFYLFVIPQYMGGAPNWEQLSYMEERYGTPILVPPEELMEVLYDRVNYQDNSHMAPGGREIFSAWLTDEMLKRQGRRSGNQQ